MIGAVLGGHLTLFANPPRLTSPLFSQEAIRQKVIMDTVLPKQGDVKTKHYIDSRNLGDVEMHGIEEEKRVPDKWIGTESDMRDMRMLGRVQVLRVSSP